MYAWQFNGIKHFTPAEVKGTGAELSDVKRRLVAALDKYREEIGRRLTILPNGMTTGDHQSWTHAAGLAGDVAYFEQDGPIYMTTYTMIAMECGFKGIGWYWNGTCYSTHLDLGNSYRQWAKWRHHGEPYSAMRTVALIQDPMRLEMEAGR